jgi:cysteine-rich repeat protein
MGMNIAPDRLSPLLSPLAPLLSAAALLGFAGCSGGGSNTTPVEPSEVASALADGLAGQAILQPLQSELAGGLYSIPSATPTGEVTPASCQEVEGLVQQACSLINYVGESDYCWGEATYFLANSTPRCAARLHLGGAESPENIYAFDLSGVAQTQAPDSCGDGEIDEGEECDDGNHEDFDGCDSTCAFEEFQGCEAVIEQYYKDAGIAIVDKNSWDGPRSHLMVNPSALALTEVNQLTCDAALSVGVDVCNEIVRQMPFVGSCQPIGGVRGENDGQCDLRFMVYFNDVDPANGAYTTALPGILAFTLGS